MNTAASHIGNSGPQPGKEHQVQEVDNHRIRKETNAAITMSQRDFEEQYLSLRKLENRIYPDEEVAKLPEIRKDHPHYKEWLLREKSSERLFSFLQNKKRELKVLEVGCGNGWLSNLLAMTGNCQITGIDINRNELDQANRVFKLNTDCSFYYADIHSAFLKDSKFDVIVFAASIQYFSSVEEILNAALLLLEAGGEIHIMDTHLYKTEELEAARQRSVTHFTSLGFPGMASNYFHHSMKDLKQFHPVILFNPFSLKNRFFRNESPFYWICIKNDQFL